MAWSQRSWWWVRCSLPEAEGSRVVAGGPDAGPRLPVGIPSVLAADGCARLGALPPARPMPRRANAGSDERAAVTTAALVAAELSDWGLGVQGLGDGTVGERALR